MEYRRLGSSGRKLSALSFGAWVTFGRQVDTAAAREMLAEAHAKGVNFFDNAEVYAHGAAEQVMGEALHALALPRDGYCVSSKAYFGRLPDPAPTQRGLSRKHLTEACQQALRRLRVEYLDLFFCHRPDQDTPVEEVVISMDSLIRQGKVLYWGTSEWPAAAIAAAAAFARAEHLIGPQMEQPQYNLLHRDRVEREYAPLYAQIGLGTTTWSPLASGLLTGKYAGGVPEQSRLGQNDYDWLRESVLGADDGRNARRAARLPALAAELGCTPAQLAIAWCLRNPRVSTVILGASRAAQLRENLGALDVQQRLDDAAWRHFEAAFAAA